MILIREKIVNLKGFLIIFFITILSVFILKLAKNDKTLQEVNSDTFIVKTEKISLKDNRPEYLFYGNIQAQNKVDIISNLSGKIINISPKVLSNDF